MSKANGVKPSILIVDDESTIIDLLFNTLSSKYRCVGCHSAEEALTLLKKETFELVLSDINMKGMSGIEILPQILDSTPDMVVMMISGEQTLDRPIEAMRAGAFDYIKKPFDLDYVDAAVRRAVEHQSLLAAKRAHDQGLEHLVEERSAELNFLAFHDVLTRLPNRTLFEDRVSQALATVRQDQQIMATLLLSIDRFEKINKMQGHDIGSCLLESVAERLRSCDLGGATIAKFDREEFAIMLPSINASEDVVRIAEKVKECLALPFSIKEQEVFITVSMGFSLFPHDGADVQTLLKNADAALFRSKEQGENRYEFYTPDMNIEANERLALENDLRGALERNEFEVYYQPKLDIKSGRIVGMEALIRWVHPVRGMVSPADFIPLAEDTGLIMPIGEWVLRTACAQSKWWQDQGFSNLSISVNLSPRQFEEALLLPNIIEIIRATGIEPNFLELEVTESAIMSDAESAIDTLRELRKMGIRIAIDDFGTGYSSLGYLRRLPIDILKIDHSFITDITTNPDDLALVMSIISLAHNLGLTAVTEGVETHEQLKLISLLRCDAWQGYLFSKPVPHDIFTELLSCERGETRRKGAAKPVQETDTTAVQIVAGNDLVTSVEQSA